jgi:DNA-binding NarL/FixJ family response regulator
VYKRQGYSCVDTFLEVESFLKAKIEIDILLLDINLPGINGVEAITGILQIYPNLQIIINTIMDDAQTIFQSLQNGAVGYIDKQSFDDNIAEVLATVANGGAYMTPKIARKVIDNFKKPKMPELSPRELVIVNGILEGLSYKLIADANFISIDTVRSHIKNIYKKLSINSKSQLFSMFKHRQ